MCKPQLPLDSIFWTYLLSLTQRGPHPSHGQVGRCCQGQEGFFMNKCFQPVVSESARVLIHSYRRLSGHEDGAGKARRGGAEAGLGGAGPFPDSQDTPFSLPQEPEAQVAQVSDVPATSQRPEQVSRAVLPVLGPCLPAGPDTPTPTGLCLSGHAGSSRAGVGVSSGTAGGSETQHRRG